MSFDRSQARCSFCGRRPPAIKRLIAGPGAAYICDTCLQECTDILNDPTPFSPKALELASRPPVVIAAPQKSDLDLPAQQQGPRRSVSLDTEQKRFGMTLMLYEMHFYEHHFEIHYVWIRPPFPTGFAFVPRLIFLMEDDLGTQWSGDKGGTLRTRPELANDPGLAVYQGSGRFRPLPAAGSQLLKIRAADPLGQFEEQLLPPWEFEIKL